MIAGLVFALLAPAAAAEIVPYYAESAPRTAAVGLRADKSVYKFYKGVLERRDITGLVLIEGAERVQVLPKKGADRKLDALDPAVLRLLEHLVVAERPGVELDALARTATGTTPVSAWWDAADVITLQVGQAWTGPEKSVGDLETFLSRWQLTLETDGQTDWQPAELALLDQALSLLTAEELALVADLPFRRSRERVLLDNGERAAATYRWDIAQGFRFEFYDLDTRSEPGFIGDPNDPRSRELLVVLHELAHALADHRRRSVLAPLTPHLARLNGSFNAIQLAEGRLEADPADAAARAELKLAREANHGVQVALEAIGLSVDAVEQLHGWHGTPLPVEIELSRRLGDAPRVTPYARQSDGESWAELFAYTRLDPAAMTRVYGDSASWLQSGEWQVLVSEEAAPVDVSGLVLAP